MRPHPDRLLGVDASVRALARELYAGVADAPIISPHGHVSAQLLAENRPFTDPAELFVTPDHYVTRLLHSSGVPLEALGLGGGATPPREIWRVLCESWAPVRRHARALLVRGLARARLRPRPDALGGERRHAVRRAGRATGAPGLAPAGAARQLRRRGARHDRRPRGHARAPRCARRHGGATDPRDPDAARRRLYDPRDRPLARAARDAGGGER